MTTQAADAFLMGSGGRSAKFEQHKDEVDGTIVSTEMRQQTDFKSGKPKTWDDGNPMMHLVVTLKIEGPGVDDEDDLLRKLYVKSQMQVAVKNAVLEVGENTLANGGRLFVRYVGDDEPSKPGMNGAKRYFAKYVAPDRSMAVPDGDPISGEPPVDYVDPDDLPF